LLKLEQFNTKTVYIVGGSTGIGLAIAQGFTRLGANVLLFARRQSVLDSAVHQCEQVRKDPVQRIEAVSLDITDPIMTERTMHECVSYFGVPDALINVAGRAIPNNVEDISYEQFDATLKINLYGCRNTIAPLIPYMKIKGGLIVNTSSMVGLIGVYGYTDYAASKFALIGYSEVLRSELKAYNIQVNVLCPPDTDTPGFATENLTKPAATHAISASANLLTPHQVAEVFFKEIVKDKFLIVPGLNGKFSVLMKRLFPGLVEFVMDRSIQRAAKAPDYARAR